MKAIQVPLPTNKAGAQTLGIVCPMANEADNAVSFVEEVLEVCRRHDFAAVTFIAVLDNVSKDNTRELLNEVSKQRSDLKVVWAPENKNVVDAYVRGYREALALGCDWILEIDAGYSHQPSDIPKFLEKIDDGYVCVFGTRFSHGGKIEDSSTKRRVISRGGSMLANLVLGTKLKDMTSGFELFSRPVLEAVLNEGIESRGPFFQTEIKTHCRNLPFAEVPIHYRAANHHINRWAINDAFSNLWRLFRRRVAGRL